MTLKCLFLQLGGFEECLVISPIVGNLSLKGVPSKRSLSTYALRDWPFGYDKSSISLLFLLSLGESNGIEGVEDPRTVRFNG